MKSSSNDLEQNIFWHHLKGNYIIDSDDPCITLAGLERLIGDKIFKNTSLAGNPDYLLIEAEGEITNDKAARLKDFLATMPLLSSEKKIAIINRAENMNIYAANACLKALEDTPQFAHIFLICESYASILPTILSRCFKITHTNNADTAKAEEIEYQDFARDILHKSGFVEKYLGIVKSKQGAENVIFKHFLRLVNAICKSDFNSAHRLSDTEKKIKDKFFSSPAAGERIKKYNKISQLIKNQHDYRLDASRCLLLLSWEIYRERYQNN